MAFVTFYHYTSKEGLDVIRVSGFIQESPFSGVYGTSLPPHKGRKKIAQNNWGSFWQKHEYAGRVDRAIELQIPKQNVQRAISDRDILIHNGPIDLDDYEWRVWKLTQSVDEESDSSSDE